MLYAKSLEACRPSQRWQPSPSLVIVKSVKNSEKRKGGKEV